MRTRIAETDTDERKRNAGNQALECAVVDSTFGSGVSKDAENASADTVTGQFTLEPVRGQSIALNSAADWTRSARN